MALTEPGSRLADAAWLGERVAQLIRQTGCPEPRTNATLWWYSASAVLLGPAVHDLVVSGAGSDLRPGAVRFTVRWNGYLERVVPGPALPPGAEALGAHLDGALGAVIEPLARLSGATERSLWAVAADSLATRVLAETAVAPAGDAQAPALTRELALSSSRIRPVPRFVDVTGDPARPPRRYPRRGSCCLLWRVPEGKCITCPAQLPAERRARLEAHARSQQGAPGDRRA